MMAHYSTDSDKVEWKRGLNNPMPIIWYPKDLLVYARRAMNKEKSYQETTPKFSGL